MKHARLLPTGPLARRSLILAAGMVFRMLLLAILFLLVSRELGASQYGQLTAVLAIAGFFFPFAGLGAGLSMVRDYATGEETPARIWGRGLFMLAATSGPLVGLALATGSWLAPRGTSVELLATLILAELALAPFIQLSAALYRARERTGVAAALFAGLALARLAAFGLLLTLYGQADARLWAWWYLGATLLFALATFWKTWLDFGAPQWNRPGIRQVLRHGLGYSLIQSSARMNGDIDKVMLARMDSLATTGLYAAGYRLLDMAVLPLSSLLWTASRRFFAAGNRGLVEALRYGSHFIRLPGIYIVAAVLLLPLAGEILAPVLGPEYDGIVDVLRLLAPLVLLLFCRQLLRQISISAGTSLPAALTELLGVGVNISANLALIPGHGWRGAAWATYLSETMMLLALTLILATGRRRQRVEAER